VGLYGSEGLDKKGGEFFNCDKECECYLWVGVHGRDGAVVTVPDGVTVLLDCYKSVARVLQACHKRVTRLLQECYKSVTRVLQECHKRVCTRSRKPSLGGRSDGACPNMIVRCQSRRIRRRRRARRRFFNKAVCIFCVKRQARTG
jgi:hypothetical protein